MAQTPDGVKPFLVEGDSPGLVRRPLSKLGRRVGDNAEIFFDDVRVPKGRILPPSPKGRTDMGTHPTIAALTLGLGRAALEETLKYTQERVSGGKHIIKHQAVGLSIAEMAMNLEAARRLLWTAAWVKDHPEAIEDGSVENLPYEHMATAFIGTMVQRLTEQGDRGLRRHGHRAGHADREVRARCARPETHLVSVPVAVQDHRAARRVQAQDAAVRGGELRRL